MDIDAVLEAFQDFDKTGKKETCPVLEQFLCHVAKTGQPLLASPISSRISWSQFKSYFMYKLEKVMDDFHASTPEQRMPHNPNVEFIPYEEMKTRILKIVDGYNGIPFTIQRLCELLIDPKRNYAGTDKFLRGLEKNVMVVSCVYPTSEKNGSSAVNRMNGVMFPGNSSLYSDSRNVNGPATPRPLNRPKLSLSTTFSSNGLPDCPVSKDSEPTTEDNEEHIVSDPSLSEGETTPSSGTKNKHLEEDDDNADDDKQEVKRLKFDEEEEDEMVKEEKELSCRKISESSPVMSEPLEDTCGQEEQSEASCDSTCENEPSNTRTASPEREGVLSEMEDVNCEENAANEEGSEVLASSESTSFDQDNEESSSSSSDVSDGECLSGIKQLPSSSSSSADLSTEDDADNANSTDTVIEPGEHE